MGTLIMKYDIHQPCIICGECCDYLNGKTNSNIVYIKTKRRSVVLVHRTCIEKEKKENEKGKQGN